jgi:hypothetical protein
MTRAAVCVETVLERLPRVGTCVVCSLNASSLPTIEFERGRALMSEISEAGLIDTVADLRIDVIQGATAATAAALRTVMQSTHYSPDAW